MNIEAFGANSFNPLPHFIALAVAYLLAFPIGWNREREARSAGLRTFPLVAVATCGFVQAAESLSALRPTSIALPPDATTAAAHALPMPLPPPVTRTVCPVNDSCTTDPFVRQLEQVLVIRHGSS